MSLLESPRQGDSSEHTQHTIFNIKKKITLSHPKSAAMGFFQKGSRMRLKQLWYKPSVFKPLKVEIVFLGQYLLPYISLSR